MDELNKIIELYNLNVEKESPIEIPNTGREQLTQLFCKLGYKVGAEIGTEQGVYAERICKNNPGVKLYCVDLWKTYQGYRDHVNQDKLDEFFSTTQTLLKSYNVKFIRKYSMDAVKDFENGSLDFVYIDANHEWPFITQDIYYWSTKVRPGGIVSGHDYYRSNRINSKCHVKGAVDGYTFAFRIHPWFLLGRNERITEEIRDTSRSWLWIKDERLH
jgi:predicted O-methyltransferase YrrM